MKTHLLQGRNRAAFHFRHIRSKLLFSYAIILIVPCLLLGYGFLHVFDDMLVRQNVQDSEKQALVLSESMKYTIGGIGEVLADFCSNSDIWAYFHHRYEYPDTSIKGYYETIRPAVDRYIALHPEILSASMFTNNPTIVTNQSEIRWMEENSAENLLMQSMMQRGTMWTIGMLEQNGQPRLVAARVMMMYRKPLGLFVVRLDPARFQALVGTEQTEGSVSVLSHEGRVVLSSIHSLLNQTAEEAGLAPALLPDAQGHADVTLNGEVHRAITIPFEVKDCRENWHLIFTDTAASLTRLASANRLVVSAIGIISLFLMGIMSVLFANKLTQRLSIISSGIAQVQNGDFSVRVNVGGADEVTTLGASLNSMTGRLDSLVNENAAIRTQKRELEMAAREARLNALQSQINPHFLFNTLEAVQYGIHAQLDGTEEVVNLLARSLRRAASWEEDCIPLRKELENVTDHLRIQQFRYGPKLQSIIDVEESLLDWLVPTLLIQPLVENAVSHGVAMKPEGGTVAVRASRLSGAIVLSVQDDGVGMDELMQEQLRRTLDRPAESLAGSIGLKNVYDRVRLFYADRAHFEIISKENEGTLVRLTVREEDTHAHHDCG